MQTDFFEF